MPSKTVALLESEVSGSRLWARATVATPARRAKGDNLMMGYQHLSGAVAPGRLAQGEEWFRDAMRPVEGVQGDGPGARAQNSAAAI